MQMTCEMRHMGEWMFRVTGCPAPHACSAFGAETCCSYLGLRKNFGTESCCVSAPVGLVKVWGVNQTHNSRQLGDRVLGVLEEGRHFLEGVDHGQVLTAGLDHPSGEVVAEPVVDVELARGSGGPGKRCKFHTRAP
ncbi:hypothetical protein HZ326_31532 [Fusarium oxysporum f. sp. albedinis]|nr:hypothetical protein HZ326_31532 [Fusarium oxysporum f. sp. albedinis]